jgi:hypothetical protein
MLSEENQACSSIACREIELKTYLERDFSSWGREFDEKKRTADCVVIACGVEKTSLKRLAGASSLIGLHHRRAAFLPPHRSARRVLVNC